MPLNSIRMRDHHELYRPPSRFNIARGRLRNGGRFPRNFKRSFHRPRIGGAPRTRRAPVLLGARAPPKPLVFQCPLLAMTRWLAGAARPQQQHHQQQRSPRAPELHRRPDGDVGQQPQRRPGGPQPVAAYRRSDRRGPEPNFSKKMELAAAARWRPQQVALSTSRASSTE